MPLFKRFTKEKSRQAIEAKDDTDINKTIMDVVSKAVREFRRLYVGQFLAVRERQVEAAFAKSQHRYLDAEIWAAACNISEAKAEKELQFGVEQGILEEARLYEGPPSRFVVSQEDIGRSFSLSDIGYIHEEEEHDDGEPTEIHVTQHNTRPIYVALTNIE